MAFVPKSAFKPKFKFIPKSESIISFNSRVPGIPPIVLASRVTKQFYIYEHSMEKDGVSYPTMMCTLLESPTNGKYLFIRANDGQYTEKINNIKQFIYEKFHVNSYYIKFMEDSHNKFSFVERSRSSQHIQKKKEKSEIQRKKIVQKRKPNVVKPKTSPKRRLPLKLEIKNSYTSVTL